MMRKLFTVVSFVAAAALIAVACSKEEKKEEPSANAAGVEAAGSLSLSEPSKMYTKAGEALASANMTGEGTSLRLDGDSSTTSTNDDLCSNHGDPWNKEANDRLADGDDFAPRVFYCLVNSKVIESTSTLPGFFKQQASIMCTMEEQLKLKADEFTEDGKEYVSGGSQELTFSDKCWAQGKPDGQTSVTMESVIGKKLAESTGWQYEIKIKNSQMDFTMRYFNKDGVFGFARFETGTSPGKGEAITAVVDTNKGVILYDSFSDRNRSSDAYRKINRFRIKGTFDKDLKFSAFTEGRGFVMGSGLGFSAEAGTEHVFAAYTVDGTKDRGYMFKTFKNGAVDKTYVNELYPKCKDSTTSCEGNTDIGTTEDMRNLEFRDENTATAWGGFIDRKPMCEKDSDGAAAIKYSPLFPNTGSFGKCE